MNALEEEILITSVTTQNSANKDKYLIPLKQKIPWYKRHRPPYALISASTLEILVYSLMRNNLEWLEFDPNKQKDVWKFFTYMLVHHSWYHLLLNVTVQCIFAINLENRQGSWRVGLLYVLSGCMGALGSACAEPSLLVGASAGVYALLISYISDVALNFRTVKYKLIRCVSVAIIVASDVIYNLIHFFNKIQPSISWAAHVSGAVTGLLIGLVLYKNLDEEKNHSKVLHVTGLLSFSSVLVVLLIINFEIRYLETSREKLDIK